MNTSNSAYMRKALKTGYTEISRRNLRRLACARNIYKTDNRLYTAYPHSYTPLWSLTRIWRLPAEFADEITP